METKSAKQRLIDAGYEWIIPENIATGSARRIVRYITKYWIVNSPEEASELANELLGKEQ